jgi:two-component system copper resistance phosphate regulon response regulator CusR
MRVLIIEDQARTAGELRSGLVNAGFEAVVATTVEEALPLAQSGVFDALVVDIMLPGRSGLDLVETLRGAGHPVPIIILSAKGNLEDRLRGLEAGADDYLAKPYSILEVVARLRTITRRAQPVVAAPVQVADLVWDPARRSVARGGRRIELTPKEYALMVLLLEHAGRVVPRSQLVKAVWGIEGAVDANAVDVQILRLRRKVDDPFPVKLIHTLRGVGLVLEPRAAD